MRILSGFFLCCGLLAGVGGSAGAQPEPPVGGQLHQARYGATAVAANGEIYVIGGAAPTEISGSIERINPKTGVSKMLILPFSIARRFFASAQSYGPYIFLFGGQDYETKASTLVERFDTRDLSVKTLAPLPQGTRTPASAVVGDKIYLAGGTKSNGQPSPALWIYDIAADSWKAGAPMLLGKECDLVARGATLYAVAGFDGKGATDDFEAYDIAADAWKALPPLPFAMSAHHGAIAADTLWEFGDYAQLGRVCAYDFAAATWRLVPDSSYTPRRHSAALALGGQVWIIGGNTTSSSASAQDAIERFDPKTEKILPFD